MADVYTTVAIVQEELGIGDIDGQYIDRLIQEASSELDQRCSRVFFRSTAFVEKVPGYGTALLRVSGRLPLLSIISIVRLSDSAGGTPETIDASLYAIDDPDIGTIRHDTGWDWTARVAGDITRDSLAGTEERLYEVTYDGGYVTRSQDEEGDFPNDERNLPFDVERACIDLVVSRYRQRGRDKSVVSERVMSAATTYTKASGRVVGLDVPPSVEALVRRWGR